MQHILAVIALVAVANALEPAARIVVGQDSDAPTSISACGLVEIVAAPIPASPTFDPWNQTQCACAATFKGPTGSFEREAFLFQNFTRDSPGQWDQLTAANGSSLVIRFAPVDAGSWSWSLSCLNGSVTSSGSISVSGSGSCRGFLRVASYDTYALAWSESGGVGKGSGARWLGLGEDMAWGSESDYLKWFGSLSPLGVNYARIWLGFNSPFFMQTVQAGLGKLDLSCAWRADELLGYAASFDVRLMLSLYSYNVLRPDHQYNGCWDDCNQFAHFLNLAGPMDWFTDPRALALHERYFRYVVARYGWSAHVHSFEFENEVDGAQDYDVNVAATWHAWAAKSVRARDTYANHLLSTSFAQHPGTPLIDGTDSVDFSQTHVYMVNDYVDTTRTYDTAKAIAYAKPSFIGEMGFSDPGTSNYDDPTAIYLLNALVAPLFALGAQSGNTWWWDNWIDPHDLFWRWATPGRIYAAAGATLETVRGQWNLTAVGPASPPPNVQLLGVAAPVPSAAAMVFVRNTQVNWKSALQRQQGQPPQLAPLNISLSSMAPSATFHYQILALNSTFDPGVERNGTTQPSSQSGSLSIPIPPNKWGVAVMIQKA